MIDYTEFFQHVREASDRVCGPGSCNPELVELTPIGFIWNLRGAVQTSPDEEVVRFPNGSIWAYFDRELLGTFTSFEEYEKYVIEELTSTIGAFASE